MNKPSEILSSLKQVINSGDTLDLPSFSRDHDCWIDRIVVEQDEKTAQDASVFMVTSVSNTRTHDITGLWWGGGQDCELLQNATPGEQKDARNSRGGNRGGDCALLQQKDARISRGLSVMINSIGKPNDKFILVTTTKHAFIWNGEDNNDLKRMWDAYVCKWDKTLHAQHMFDNLVKLGQKKSYSFEFVLVGASQKTPFSVFGTALGVGQSDILEVTRSTTEESMTGNLFQEWDKESGELSVYDSPTENDIAIKVSLMNAKKCLTGYRSFPSGEIVHNPLVELARSVFTRGKDFKDNDKLLSRSIRLLTAEVKAKIRALLKKEFGDAYTGILHRSVENQTPFETQFQGDVPPEKKAHIVIDSALISNTRGWRKMISLMKSLGCSYLVVNEMGHNHDDDEDRVLFKKGFKGNMRDMTQRRIMASVRDEGGVCLVSSHIPKFDEHCILVTRKNFKLHYIHECLKRERGRLTKDKKNAISKYFQNTPVMPEQIPESKKMNEVLDDEKSHVTVHTDIPELWQAYNQTKVNPRIVLSNRSGEEGDDVFNNILKLLQGEHLLILKSRDGNSKDEPKISLNNFLYLTGRYPFRNRDMSKIQVQVGESVISGLGVYQKLFPSLGVEEKMSESDYVLQANGSDVMSVRDTTKTTLVNKIIRMAGVGITTLDPITFKMTSSSFEPEGILVGMFQNQTYIGSLFRVQGRVKGFTKISTALRKKDPAEKDVDPILSGFGTWGGSDVNLEIITTKNAETTTSDEE